MEGWEGLGVGGSGAGEAAALERPGGAPEAVRRLLRELGRDTGVDGCLRVKRRIWGWHPWGWGSWKQGGF